MANLKEWLLEAAGEEPIEAIVIGQMGRGDYGHEEVPRYDETPKGKVLSWDRAASLIDYEFDAGYGSPGCQAVYAWTPTRVIAISQYDGSTCPFSIPRNPQDVMPEMPGG